MGSGLILLIIVGAWLAVLVPMALRSHEASNALGTVDKFHDAMRVLSRRDGVARAGRRGPRPPYGGGERMPSGGGADVPDDADDEAQGGPGRSGAAVGAEPRERGDLAPGPVRTSPRTIRIGASDGRSATRPPRQALPAMPAVPFLGRGGGDGGSRLTAPARRRRALSVLCALVLLTLVGALVGPGWLVVPQVLADVLLVAFLVWLRRTASARRSGAHDLTDVEPADGAAAVVVPAARLVPPRHVAGIPECMPARSLIDGRYAVVPAARVETVLAPAAEPPARGAQGEPWQPVPVPVPTYVNAPTAPQVALGRVEAQVRPQAEHSLGIAAQGHELDDLPERRRAVGD